MVAVLVVFILVCGFIYTHIHPLHFLKLHRFAGQYLYLHCAKYGLYIMATAIMLHIIIALITTSIAVLFDFNIDNQIVYFSNIIRDASLLPNEHGTSNFLKSLLFLSTVTAFAFSFFLAYLQAGAEIYRYLKELEDRGETLSYPQQLSDSNKLEHWTEIIKIKLFGPTSKGIPLAELNTRMRIKLLGEILDDSPLDQILFSSAGVSTLMLTMSDRKVYVGEIFILCEPSATKDGNQEILFRVQKSGYRDKDTLKVNFTTQYTEIGKEIIIILRQENIVSATIFEETTYNRFQDRWENQQFHIITPESLTR